MQISTTGLKGNTRKGITGQEFTGKDKKPKTNVKVTTKPPERLSSAVIEADLCAWIDGDDLPFSPNENQFERKFGVYRPQLGQPQAVEFDLDKRVVRLVRIEELAAAMWLRMAKFKGESVSYQINFKQCVDVAKCWLNTSRREMREWPKAVAFHSEKGPCFSRLNFDPASTYDRKDFPIISEMLNRMTNAKAFSTMLGSVVFAGASRKQAVWLHGESNSGKSFLLNNLVSPLCGGQSGTATFSGESLKGDHWKEPLLGKSLLVINEASAKFIRSESFKSLTGDDLHMINPKGLKMFQGKLECRVFFSSNEAPEIPNDDALINRIIECEMTAVPADRRVSAVELDKMIEVELPFYIAYCMDLYRQVEGRSIESDQTGIKQAIANYESDLQFTFDRCFEIDEQASLSSNDFQLYLEKYLDYKRGITLMRMRQFIDKTYGIKPRQKKIGGKNVNRYLGMKVRADWGMLPLVGQKVEG